MKRQSTQNQPKMIMMAYNPISRKVERVFPEDEVTIEQMVPMFWSRDMKKYATIPDCPAADVYDEWLAATR